ncbi:PepSY-associated TM helix domain-containing protein [Rhodovibrio salinarum]|uniref:PepSY domain-containing protein n=1 Tax=Rhodovibrio salinarum TaxID=1087 RepID=A0A934QLF3_9PROT|nr:PepSY-associated TM helix domain-containing protein [Rhodovibrio salinarum]MBK1699142.1 PepSY domain-containing protein [Rhodovibrio salinarum]
MKTRAWFRVHSFTGVITGLLLFVICWSGTVATLSHEIDWLVTPEARVAVGAERASWGDILAAVEAAFPEAQVTSLQAPLYPRSAAEVLINRPEQARVRVYVDPYTAEVRGAYSYMNVWRFFRSLHRNLFFPTQWGVLFVSAFAVTMLVSLVGALCFYKRWWTRFFRFKAGKGRTLWSELHKTGGLWSLWFVLLISVTGAWYGIERARYEFADGIMAYVGAESSSVHPAPQPTCESTRPDLPLDAVVARARSVRPDMDLRHLRPGECALYLDGQADHLLVRDRANRLYVDRHTGEVLYDQRASDLPLYWRWANTADPLHYGDFGGLASKLVWCVFGLALSGLILTGTWLHVHRLAREAGGKARARWPGTMAACAISLGVLAASVPLGFFQTRDLYGPLVDGTRQLPTLAPGVRAVILGWIVLTMAMIGGWIFALWRPQMLVRDVARGSRRCRGGSRSASRSSS